MISNNMLTDFSNENVVESIMESSMVEAGNSFGNERIAQVVESGAEIAKSSNALVSSLQTVVEAINFVFQRDCETLKAVTTHVNGFDPLSQYNETAGGRFIPVLEARGGSDKDELGHRRDSMPIAEAIAQSNIHSAIFQFLDERGGEDELAVQSNDALGRFLGKIANGVVVRVNPGTLSTATQFKVDNLFILLTMEPPS